uniref:Basic proline-rich protein-like n=1 Tax=Callorhinus ursinus TaxID=34884 RepID=A0A3Q7PUM1_CALUR|nr:basic proline-rich protein-like [Callorhinus ursinus]
MPAPACRSAASPPSAPSLGAGQRGGPPARTAPRPFLPQPRGSLRAGPDRVPAAESALGTLPLARAKEKEKFARPRPGARAPDREEPLARGQQRAGCGDPPGGCVRGGGGGSGRPPGARQEPRAERAKCAGRGAEARPCAARRCRSPRRRRAPPPPDGPSPHPPAPSPPRRCAAPAALRGLPQTWAPPSDRSPGRSSPSAGPPHVPHPAPPGPDSRGPDGTYLPRRRAGERGELSAAPAGVRGARRSARL